ncbi:MAG TPA: ABC transporter substrate-binding protein [Thermoanaerobaculia bacterium]|nr:ABC transporter substrate-binding protein [Thermoanaerobaculia bacterium]
MNRPIRILLPILSAALLAACGNREEPRPRPEGAAGTPRRGGTVVTGWTTEPLGVNELIMPTTAVNGEVLGRVLEPLVQEEPDFMEHPATFTPKLAESWEWSADHKTLTFHLRKNLVWSDGAPLTAEDVRWTWQAQTNPDVSWESSYMKESIPDVEVVDPQTVRFHYSRVYAKQMQDANEGRILPQHLWGQIPFAKWRDNADWFKQHLVASGPFKIGSWTPQQELVLVRNERYWEKDRPYLDRVVMRVVPDAGSLLTQLLNGELDFIFQVSVDDAARVEARHDLYLVSFWSNLYVVVAWNGTRPLFADPDVRRALTLGIDRQAIVDTLLPGGNGRVAVSPIIQSIWAHDKTLQPWPYDPAEARRILAAKGWKDSNGDGILDRGGKKFSFELASNAGNQARNDAAVMIQQQLRKIGVQATPRILEFNSLVTNSRSGDFDAIIMGFSIDTSLDLSGNFHSRSIPSGDNFFHYSNPEVDRLIDLAASQKDLAAGEPYLHQVERLIHRDQPVTFLWESKRLAALNKRVHDARPNLQAGFYNLKDWWVEPRR